jgi:hypothetical protein
MKETELRFRGDDPAPVVYDEARQVEATKKYQELRMAIETLFERHKAGELTEGFKEVLLSCSENYTLEFLKVWGYENVLEKEKQERYREIRERNIENRELRKQLGEKVSNEDVRERLKLIADHARDWWNEDGLGFITDFEFTPYSFNAKISGNLSVGMGEKEIEELKAQGFEVCDEHLMDTDKNKELLLNLVRSKFPTAEIREYDIKDYPRTGRFIQAARIYVTDFNEFPDFKNNKR